MDWEEKLELAGIEPKEHDRFFRRIEPGEEVGDDVVNYSVQPDGTIVLDADGFLTLMDAFVHLAWVEANEASFVRIPGPEEDEH
ncbi:MAG: hypothetical protein AAF514_12435 [Verrucomicrobiota bacterium]